MPAVGPGQGKFGVKLEGFDDFQKKLRRIGKPSKQVRMLSQIAKSGLAPVARELRRAIRSEGAVRKGHMKRGVITKSKVYTQSGSVWAAVGLADKVLADGENPGKYFHLVSLGTRRHWQKKLKRWHPGARPRNLREQAIRGGQSEVAERMMKQYERLMTRELLKRR